MPAMKMYKVKTPDLTKDLHPGDVIDFKIDAANYTIVGVKLLAHAKTGYLKWPPMGATAGAARFCGRIDRSWTRFRRDG